jgi:Flp pilus assembly protein TadD
VNFRRNTREIYREKYLQNCTKRGGYSAQEVVSIYELGRFCLENGDVHRAEAILLGLVNVAPDFAPSWMGLTCIYLQNGNNDLALQAANQAYRLSPDSIEVILFFVASLLSNGDYNAAGTYLGEVSDKIESGSIESPNALRFHRMQLARYQSRA